MEVTELTQCFFSTFIHYFLIKLANRYFYMFIRLQDVYKE